MIDVGNPKQLRPMPHGFEDDARRGMSLAMLRAKYQTSNATIYRWFDELGLMRSKGRPGRPVCKIDPDTEALLETYNSAAEAARAIYGDENAIRACCRGKARTSYGYFWKFADALQNDADGGQRP